MKKESDVWIVIEKGSGEPLESHVTGTMSPELRDFYNRSKDFAVVQGKLVYELPQSV